MEPTTAPRAPENGGRAASRANFCSVSQATVVPITLWLIARLRRRTEHSRERRQARPAMAESTEVISSCLNLMRRLPPKDIENSLAGLLSLVPDATDELLQRVDQVPLPLLSTCGEKSLCVMEIISVCLGVLQRRVQCLFVGQKTKTTSVLNKFAGMSRPFTNTSCTVGRPRRLTIEMQVNSRM